MPNNGVPVDPISLHVIAEGGEVRETIRRPLTIGRNLTAAASCGSFATHREGAIRLALRKLHVRWWHASEHVMKRFLDRVGVAEKVLQLIPEIVQTCKICRKWAKLGPDNVCSVEIPDKFNDQVECDLLFVRKHINFHMICRCTRWHAARVIPDKKR